MTTVFSTTLIGAETAVDPKTFGPLGLDGPADAAATQWVDLTTGDVHVDEDNAGRVESPVGEAHRGGMALYLGDEQDEGACRFAAWWHPAAPGAGGVVRRHAVVLCSALGREEMSSHASLRALAGRLSEQGFSCLRFDYPGCGDSGGDELDPRAVEHWLASIEVAMDALRALSGAARVVLLGVRAGALLASQVAQRRPEVAAVAGWMPVLSGRTHLRELRLLGSGTGSGGDTPNLFEAGGHAMHVEAAQALQGLDVRRAPLPMARRWLILERDDLIDPQGLSEWADQLRRSGALVAHERLPGYAAMMLDPHHGRVPQDWCEATVEWLRALEPVQGEQDTAETVVARLLRSTRATLEPPAHLRPGRTSHLELRGVREGMVQVPVDGAVLNGVFSEPDPCGMRVAGPVRAVLLVNAGGARRTGPGRLYVDLARALARAGHCVLRLDLSGIGESEARAGEAPQVAYPVHGVAETAAAAEFLHRRTGCEVDVVGLCAGAYHALHAAVRQQGRSGSGWSGVLAINPLTFRDPGPLLPTAVLSAHKAASEMARYRANLWSMQRWRRLLSGQVNWRGPLRVVGRQLRARSEALWREVRRTVGHPLPDDVGAQLAALADAGVSVGFLFAEQDPGPVLLRSEAGSCLARLRRSGAYSEVTVPQADHTFTRWAWREAAIREVMAWVRRTR